MGDRFVAIDFETANADLASICQIGAVTFEGGVVREAGFVTVFEQRSDAISRYGRVDQTDLFRLPETRLECERRSKRN